MKIFDADETRMIRPTHQFLDRPGCSTKLNKSATVDKRATKERQKSDIVEDKVEVDRLTSTLSPVCMGLTLTPTITLTLTHMETYRT